MTTPEPKQPYQPYQPPQLTTEQQVIQLLKSINGKLTFFVIILILAIVLQFFGALLSF